MIGDTTIENNKKVRKQKPVLKIGYCKQCFSRTRYLCCKQVVQATTFKNNAILKTSCKSSYIIYLLECLQCQLQCFKIRNRIQCKAQLPQKRCHQEGQYTSIKSFGHRQHYRYMRNLYLQNNLIKQIWTNQLSEKD